MSGLPREVPGETVWERAVNLAGMLAEKGVTQVELVSGGERRVLLARKSDLVQEIVRMCEAGGGELDASGVKVVITRGSIRVYG
jgi:hypothetical protein